MPDDYNLVPVEHDPFGFVPVDHDPFASPADGLVRTNSPLFNQPRHEPLRLTVHPTPSQQWESAIEEQRQRDLRAPPTGEQILGIAGRTGEIMAAPILNQARRMGEAFEGGIDWSDPEAVKQASGGTLLDMVGLVGGTAGAAERGTVGALGGKPPITAYHGSPHDFDRFDLSKIGTGEGAQAYGHGLYFAENPEVADLYSRVVTADKTGWHGAPEALRAPQAQGIPDDMRGRLEASWQNNGPDVARNMARKMFDENRGTPYSDALHHLAYDADWSPRGKRYQVAIKADPEHFLDWDKPLSEQPAAVQKAVERARHAGHEIEPEVTGAEIYRVLMQHGMEERLFPGGEIDRIPTKEEGTRTEREVANELARAGMPGIKYLDQGSRTAGEGSRNYVVFDDKLIDILKKYGIAGIGALPAMGAYHFKTHQVDHDPFKQ